MPAIAALQNVDPVARPVDLGFTLSDHVDTTALLEAGALAALVGDGTGSGDVVVTVGIDDYLVRIEDTGRLVVDYSNVDGGPDECAGRE